jgi:hypothetical protein
MPRITLDRPEDARTDELPMVSEHQSSHGSGDQKGTNDGARHKRPNDPSSATRRAGRVDGNRGAMAGFAAAHN